MSEETDHRFEKLSKPLPLEAMPDFTISRADNGKIEELKFPHRTAQVVDFEIIGLTPAQSTLEVGDGYSGLATALRSPLDSFVSEFTKRPADQTANELDEIRLIIENNMPPLYPQNIIALAKDIGIVHKNKMLAAGVELVLHDLEKVGIKQNPLSCEDISALKYALEKAVVLNIVQSGTLPHDSSALEAALYANKDNFPGFAASINFHLAHSTNKVSFERKPEERASTDTLLLNGKPLFVFSYGEYRFKA